MDRLEHIREQKQELKRKIMELQGQKVSQNTLSQQAMAALYQKKARLQHERLQQQKYKKMQQEYNQRKAQAERQKQLQRIRNQKRMIELEVGMKRIVLNGVQQKVKGINSDQLLTRAMLQNNGQQNKFKIGRSKQQIKNEFEKYLLKQNIKKQKPKHDLYQLNQKRFQLFEKKQQLLMREILLKQIINRGQQNELQGVDIMRCNKQELQKLLQEHGIDIEDYKHPIDSKIILENYPKIQETIKGNLKIKKQQMQTQEEKKHRLKLQRTQLRDWVKNYYNKPLLKDVVQIIDDLLYQLVFEYQKRHFPLTAQQKYFKIQQLNKQYQQILFQNQYYELAQHVVDIIQQRIQQQLLYQTAQQVHQLHDFAHDTTAMSFDWIFNKTNYLQSVKMNQNKLNNIKLNFKNQSDNIRYDKNNKKPTDKLNPTNKQSQQNIFQTQKSTSQLINDIKLLTIEQQFFNNFIIQIKRQLVDSIDQNDFKVNNQSGLYVISEKGIKIISQEKDVSKNVYQFSKDIKNIKNVLKFNHLWIVQTNQNIYVHNSWNNQVLPMAIGERINSPSGNISNIQIYPTFSLLGSLCSILIGFQKGQILKYNFNRNRINSIQTNLTHYVPLGPYIKTGDDPAFPLNNRNVIEFKTQKAKDGDMMHQFRQFFDYHTTQIVNVCYYKDNMFITVDKSLNCAIWLYDMRRGVKSYQPYYTFKIRSQYKTYKQSQNPRFKDLYPSSSITQSGEQLYKKWMEQQAYLKLQIYNNPKKNSAFFRSPQWQDDKPQQPLWKLNYDQKNRKIIKIFQTYYTLNDGKYQCRQVKVWRQYVIFLIQRQHPMRSDLKTVKIYTWSIQQKKLRTVGIQFDTFQQQKVFSFEIIQNKIQNNDFPLIATISSGKILIFSMLSGQLLKDISQQDTCKKIKNYNFTSVSTGYFDNFYGITRRTIVQFTFKNKNNKQKNNQFTKTIQITKKKYNNLI